MNEKNEYKVYITAQLQGRCEEIISNFRQMYCKSIKRSTLKRYLRYIINELKKLEESI